MKLLAVQRHEKATHLFEASPREVKTMLARIFKETKYDYVIAMNQGRLYIMELRQDVTEHKNPNMVRQDPQWNTTEIKYHPLAYRLVNEEDRRTFLTQN